MTETVSGAAKRIQAAGMTIERVFSTEGVHPYDELTWERRDVVQTNWKTGDTVFEQRGVEFPSTWSVNASTIVTTKYFRGAVGTDVREWSLKQLIDRVVSTYVKGGRDHGYFTTPADAEVFEHELTWLLVNQYFSFNYRSRSTSAPSRRSRSPPASSSPSTTRWTPSSTGTRRRASSSRAVGCRPEPLPHPLLQGAAVLGRHGQRPGLLHARRRRLRGTIRSGGATAARPRWSSSTSTTPTSSSSSRPRRARRTRSARWRRRLRHGPRWPRHHLGAVPERQQLRARQRRVHARGRGGHRLRVARPARPTRSSRRSTPASCSPRSPRRRGSAPTRVCSTTTRSTTGTPTRRPAASPRRPVLRNRALRQLVLQPPRR